MILPQIPDEDADFTPDMARKIIAKYQELLAAKEEGPESYRDTARRVGAARERRLAETLDHARLLEKWMQEIIEIWHCGDIKPEDIARGRALLEKSEQPNTRPMEDEAHDAIAAAFAREGLTYNTVRRAARAVLALTSQTRGSPHD